MTGTMRTKSGRDAARIRDPVKKKHIWLGTFGTSEEAANAYLSKQCEFKARKGIQPVICNESDIMICTRNCAEKPNEIMTGTLRTKSGRYGARIRDPFKKKHVWLGTFDTPEEAANAYLSKQREFKARKGAQPVICNDITTHRRDWGEKSTEIYTGVMRWKLRSYRDLVKKKHAWLGTFDTSKNAGNAYLSEKRDFEARKGVQPSVCTESEHRNMTDRRNGSEKPNEIMTGTLRTKSGRYGARIRDPFKKKHVWLGTFDTPEEAAYAYLSKQHEFKARKGAQPVICNESDITTHRRDWGEKSTEICTGVMRRKPRSYRDLVKKKHAWLGTFDTSKKAGNAYLSEQHYFEARKGIQPTVCMEPKCRNMTDRRNGSEKPNEIMTGTLRTKSGRYGARIRDPFKKKHVWLGTFDTSEEAANAFLSKKREFETRKGVQPIGCNEFESRNRTYRRDGGEKSTEVLTEVLRKRRYGARITEPMKRKHIWLGSFDAAEEAVDAHLSKTSDFKDREGLQSTACKETELDPSNESPSSLPETQTWTSPDHMDTESETCNFNATEVVKLESVEMNGSYVLGLFEPVAGCPKFKAGSDFFLPILDNNGFLLGEFSKLDDLSICHNEDDNVPTKF